MTRLLPMTTRARLPLLVIALAVVAPAGSALGDVRAGHSGWEWGNPRPQGHAVRALEFQGDVGYAVGDFGTVLNTTDAGATWSGVNSGVTVDLAHVAIVDDDSLVVAGSCSLRRSDDS